MLSHVWSSTTIGVEALPIEIETHIEPGLPRYTVVGLPDNAIREGRDRVWAALKNAGFAAPRGVVTVNLAPADVRKEGSAFDLPIAVSLLAASGAGLPQAALDELFLMGELSLDGSLRPVRGVLPMAIRARQDRKRGVLVPAENAPEAAVVEDLHVYPIAHLREAVEILRGGPGRRPAYARPDPPDPPGAGEERLDFSDVRGQENVKRALEVAAAGGHNVLLVGPPGAGKTMLARRLPTILPPLSAAEALETTKIHSVGGKLKGRYGLVRTRPFRAPHHTISDVGLCGGGSSPVPGEISLAHHGVLFLDELPEFRRSVLEVLRQPLEEGRICISRARSAVEYPARFMLVASMNPCPCGYLDDPAHRCGCTPQQVQRYAGRVSGPLLDRIDLHVEVTAVPFEELSRREPGEPSARIRERVTAARRAQAARFAGEPGVHDNAGMDARLVRRHCALDASGQRLLKLAIQKLGLSARGYDRILKVARTVADLAAAERIGPDHLAEAIQYRSLDRARF